MKAFQCFEIRSPRAAIHQSKTLSCTTTVLSDIVRSNSTLHSRRKESHITQSNTSGTCPTYTRLFLGLSRFAQGLNLHVVHAETVALDMDNGASVRATRFSTQSESGSFLHHATPKGSEGPALVVFSGGTAFNSVAGVLLIQQAPQTAYAGSCDG
jgi:hypothetical protein